MKKRTLVDSVAIFLIALVIVAGYQFAPRLLPKADITVQPEPGCDLHRQPCAAALPGGGTLSFSIAPHPIPTVAPLQLEVALAGRDATRVEVDLNGVNMDMGLNRPQLEPQGNGRFSGRGTLPVCVTGTMDWQATVLMETARERIAVPFRFISGKR